MSLFCTFGLFLSKVEGQQSVPVSAGGSTISTLFAGNSTPSVVSQSDSNAVELGVKFQSSAPGTIAAIRFYKGPKNTGIHTAHLWSATGVSLATATFSKETATGWQQVNLSTPVSIKANTTYVVSYHAPKGFYSANGNYFASARASGQLKAPASRASGGNGVYVYGRASKFPTNTFHATNYWVDAVFVSVEMR